MPHVLIAALPAFLASLVEFVEALTIVLAVGAASGWRASLAGAAGGLITLLLLIAIFGRSLAAVPERTVEVVVGALLLLFGFRWLRKGCLRAAGILALHDEALAFERTRAALGARGAGSAGSVAAVATSFNAVMLEGIEVIFIVLALGSVGGAFVSASLGAGAAFVVVLALGVVVHRPLQRVPENALKLLVGIMLCAFGTLWLGEAMGVDWIGGDLAVFALVAGYGATTIATIGAARRVRHRG